MKWPGVLYLAVVTDVFSKNMLDERLRRAKRPRGDRCAEHGAVHTQA